MPEAPRQVLSCSGPSRPSVANLTRNQPESLTTTSLPLTGFHSYHLAIAIRHPHSSSFLPLHQPVTATSLPLPLGSAFSHSSDTPSCFYCALCFGPSLFSTLLIFPVAPCHRSRLSTWLPQRSTDPPTPRSRSRTSTRSFSSLASTQVRLYRVLPRLIGHRPRRLAQQ